MAKMRWGVNDKCHNDRPPTRFYSTLENPRGKDTQREQEKVRMVGAGLESWPLFVSLINFSDWEVSYLCKKGIFVWGIPTWILATINHVDCKKPSSSTITHVITPLSHSFPVLHIVTNFLIASRLKYWPSLVKTLNI